MLGWALCLGTTFPEDVHKDNLSRKNAQSYQKVITKEKHCHCPYTIGTGHCVTAAPEDPHVTAASCFFIFFIMLHEGSCVRQSRRPTLASYLKACLGNAPCELSASIVQESKPKKHGNEW